MPMGSLLSDKQTAGQEFTGCSWWWNEKGLYTFSNGKKRNNKYSLYHSLKGKWGSSEGYLSSVG